MKFVPAAIGFGLALTAFAAERTGEFRVDANVVLINATVLGRHDRPIRGLTRDQFRVFEDKAEQRIAYFSEEEVPISLAVIFDVSGSMDGKMASTREALDAVLDNANGEDEFSLITFAARPQVATGWSANSEDIQNRLLEVSPHGQTSLLDALETGLAQLRKARNLRKAMIIFSDGGDNHSRSTEREVMHSLEEAGVQIYAIDSAPSWTLRARSPEEWDGPDLLDRLCDLAGGRYFQVDSKRELQRAAEQIARELHSQYLIGYVPAGSTQDGRFHHVQLQVKRAARAPKITVFWRKGYRAGAD
jgi:Ca-activated chloride channel homolog